MDNLPLGDLPTMASSTYASATTPLNMLGMALNSAAYRNPVHGTIQDQGFLQHDQGYLQQIQRAAKANEERNRKEPMTSPARRLVKVVIVDPNENIPLDQCVLYSGEEKVTDATDQELFFEINIKDMLAKHNEKRVKLVDKKVKERTEHLEPAKIRDLKMVVVNIAQF